MDQPFCKTLAALPGAGRATVSPMPNDLSSFPITRKWPARHPDRIQLYSLPTPNGVKVSILLEETGLPYEVHRVDFAQDDQTSAEFLSLNPNNKIPAILDPQGPGGKPLALFESGAMGRHAWVAGDEYSAADIAIFPWVRNLVGFYAAGELVQFERFANVARVLDAFLARPAVQRGLQIPART